MPFRRYIRLILPAVALILMVACGGQSVQTTPAPIPPTDAPATEPPAATEAPATAEPAPTAEIEVTEPDDSLAGLPAGVFYDLGEATIIQANFPEDSRFRSMPVRLNGVLSVPESGDGPFPVVLILHGTHPGCPVNDMGVDAWPCDPLEERDNYAGFEYLVRELAARGYVALAININAENTFGFGEPVGGERLLQLVDLHLSALAAAAAGGANDFGVELDGVANVQQLTLMGHSRGGDMVNWLAGDRLNGPNLTAPDAFATHGYGPVNGLLLIAPAVALFGSEGTAVPLAAIISACDGDVTDGSGQDFYEQVRLDEGSTALAASVVLAAANHNGFNTTLGGDGFPPTDRPDCQTLLEPEAQRQFLVDYAADFLTLLDSPDAAERSAAAARLGLDAGAPAPAELYGQAVQLASHAAAADRLTVFVPADEGDMTTNRLGGTIIADVQPRLRAVLAAERHHPRLPGHGGRQLGRGRGRVALRTAGRGARSERLYHGQPARGGGPALAAERLRRAAGSQHSADRRRGQFGHRRHAARRAGAGLPRRRDAGGRDIRPGLQQPRAVDDHSPAA